MNLLSVNEQLITQRNNSHSLSNACFSCDTDLLLADEVNDINASRKFMYNQTDLIL